MKKYRIEVEKVNGYCSRNYKVGDEWEVEGFDTPDRFCGGAYTALFPIIAAFQSGASFHFEKNPKCKTKMACPDNGNIIFKVQLLED